MVVIFLMMLWRWTESEVFTSRSILKQMAAAGEKGERVAGLGKVTQKQQGWEE